MRTHDDIIADGCASLEGMDLITSPNGGHLVVVAISDGRYVCQGCGEPFEAEGSKRLVEVRTAGATVPVALHAGCSSGPQRRIFGALTERGLSKAMAGVRQLKVAKRAIAYSNHLAEVAKSADRKIIG